MVLGCLGVCAMALALERRIPASVNGLPAEPAPGTQVSRPS